MLNRAWVVAMLLAGAAEAAPKVGPNVQVDLDNGLAFPRNKQNEPAITRDPLTGTLIAGANDELGEPYCAGTTAPLASPCPFKAGVPNSFYYRSTDNGQSWTGGPLPGFDLIGRTSGGDPSLDYGPRRCADNRFDYACGSNIYYASLGDPAPFERGGEIATVSRSSDAGNTWATPSIATTTDSNADFVDHEWVAVDHTAGGAHFGRVYLNWAVFCNNCAGNGNTKLYVAYSDDEARTWSKAVQVSAANSNSPQGSRETGQMAVSSDGTVVVTWTENADATNYPSIQTVATSKDGGKSFTQPISLATVVDYPAFGTPFNAVDAYNRVPGMSARVDCYPHPASDPSSTKIYVVWCDFASGQGVVDAAVSSDGLQWTLLHTVAQVSGRNAFFPQASVSSGGVVALAFDALTSPPAGNPWQTGVQVYDAYYAQLTPGAAGFTNPVKVSSASSNPDASSYNNLKEQFIGDYIGVVAGPSAATLVWTDARNAALCGAVDDYRSAVYAGSTAAVSPNPDNACAVSFGNTDTYSANVVY